MTPNSFPYYVPGLPPGGEMEDLETLERLLTDLRRYASGRPPDASELAASPIVEHWATLQEASGIRIVGIVDGHPRVGPGPALTSRVYAVDHGHVWVRTYSRLWRLGRRRGPESLNGSSA